MIGRICGVLLDINDNTLLVDLTGLGFNVMVSERSKEKLRFDVGKKITLFTETVVREDNILLYGFLDKKEKECFQLITSVSGMGPKLAMAVLSVLPVAEFYRAIALEESQVLMQVSGVGKKTSQRMILELRDKVSSLAPEIESKGAIAYDLDEVNDALLALGFLPEEYLETANNLKEKGYEINDIIRLTLKELGRGRGL